VAGLVELTFAATTQTVVQLKAPVEIRGRVIRAFAMSAPGMRVCSAIAPGLLGEVVGICGSLSINAGLLSYWWQNRHSPA
jgi:hypothetical protein